MRKFLKIMLRIFYRNISGADPLVVLGTVFLMQKIVGFNRMVSWPVHFTSRVLYRKRIKVGKRTFPGWSHGCYIQARNGIEIGDNLRMGPNVGLISSNHSAGDYDQWEASEPIIIGNNVWIGMNSVVLPGVSIGDNVIIGANSVVNDNIPSDTIAAGSPCRAISKKAPYEGMDYGVK